MPLSVRPDELIIERDSHVLDTICVAVIDDSMGGHNHDKRGRTSVLTADKRDNRWAIRKKSHGQ